MAPTTTRDQMELQAQKVLDGMREQLPPEIITQVFLHADTTMMQKLRLVSKKMDRFAEPELFRRVTVRLSKASFEKLINIASCVRLNNYVRVLIYDGRLLPWGLQDYYHYLSAVLSHYGYTVIDEKGPSKPGEEKKELAHCFSATEFQGFHEQYLMLLEDQKDLHRGDAEVELLTDAFAKLPNLCALYFESGIGKDLPSIFKPSGRTRNQHRERWAKALRGLSGTGQLCLIEPGFDHRPTDVESIKPQASNFHIKRLLALVEASKRSGKHIEFLATEMLNLHQLYNKIKSPVPADIQQFLAGLSHLSIRLGDWGCPLEAWDRAVAFIACAKNVQTLSVHGSGENPHLSGRQARMDSLLVQTLTNLKELKLEGLWLDLDDFVAFIVSLVKLRSMVLVDVHLTHGQQNIEDVYILDDPQDSDDDEILSADLRHYPHPVNPDPAVARELWLKLGDSLKDRQLEHLEVWIP